MSNIELIRNNVYDTDFVLIDGHCNSGKILISRILESFNNIEKSREDFIFYYLMQLYRFKLMDESVIKVLLRISRDRILYDQTIGRDINTRPSDVTSIFKTPYPLDYFKRIFNKEREFANDIINEKRPIFQNMIANALSNSNIFFKTFDNHMKFIYILRNPIEIIYNMNKRKIGERIGSDPSEVQFTYDWNGKSIPISAYGSEEEYLKSKPIDRIIMMINILTKLDSYGYKNLDDKYKKNVIFINFDKFVINPKKNCIKISNFLDTKMTWKTNLLLRKENCPRKINDKNLNDIRKNIYSICSNDSRYILIDLEENYRKIEEESLSDL
jgi:hypothetical protein